MKKVVVLLLLSFSMAAQAQKWILIDESPDGATRLFAESGSLQVERNKNGVLVASATFSYTNKGTRSVIVAATTIEACAAGGGQIIYGNDTERVRHWWDATGKRLYDSMAKAICFAVEATLQQNRQEGRGI